MEKGMSQTTESKIWDSHRREKTSRLQAIKRDGKIVRTDNIVDVLETLIKSGDRVVVEGNNQKQADFLARSLAKVDPEKIHDLHMIIPSISIPEHLDIDVTALKIGKSIKVGDLHFDGLELATSKDVVVCSIKATRKSAAAANSDNAE